MKRNQLGIHIEVGLCREHVIIQEVSQPCITYLPVLGDIERNNTKSDRKTKKRRSKAENLQIDNEVHDTIYSERKETTGSLKVELIFKEKSKPYPEVSSIYETKKIKEKPDLDHLETGTQGDQPLPLDRVNAADCSMEKEVGKEKRRKRRKPSENISLIHEKESSGFEKYKMKDSAETIESRGEKITGISSKIGSLIQKKTESERENDANASKEKEKSREHQKKCRKPTENIPLINEKKSSQLERNGKIDSEEAIETIGESLMQKKTKVEREIDVDLSMQKKKSEKRQQIRRKPTDNVSLENETESGGLKKPETNESEESIEARGEKGTGICQQIGSLMLQKTEVERENDVGSIVEKEENRDRRKKGRKPAINRVLVNEKESSVLENHEMKDSEEAIKCKGEKNTEICFKKTEVERENDADSTMEKGKSRERRQKGRKPAENIVLVNEKESNGLEKHEMNDTEDAVESKGEKHTGICSKKTKVGRENEAGLIMEKEKSRERRQKGRKPAEHIVLVNEESSRLEKHEMNDSEEAVESKGEKNTGILSKKTEVERENDAGSTMEKEKSRERRQKGRKPAINRVLVNEKESSGLEKHEMNDFEEAVESTGKKNTGILSKKTEVERENDAGSTMEKEKSRERRQKGRKPAINRVLVNGKESSGLEKHEMNDSEEALESTGEKNTGILSKKTEVEREKDAGSPVEKEKSRERRQKGRKPAENIVLVNEKESSGLEKHEMNDSGEAVESKGEKNTGILSKKTEVERENDAGSTVEKEKSRERRQKERKPAENILLVNEKVSSGLEKHEMNDSEEAVESKGEKNTGILSKKTEVERENDAGSTMEKEKSRERRQKERKPAENIVLVNEKESRGLDKHEMDDSEEGIKTRGEKNAAICSTNKSLIQEKIDHSKKKMVSFPAESEEILLPRISVLTEKKKLLVLDLNGLLVDVVPGSTGTYRAPIKVGQKSGECSIFKSKVTSTCKCDISFKI